MKFTIDVKERSFINSRRLSYTRRILSVFYMCSWVAAILLAQPDAWWRVIALIVAIFILDLIGSLVSVSMFVDRVVRESQK